MSIMVGAQSKRLKENNDINRYVFVACIIAALSGLLFGLDIGVISGALPFISKAFGLATQSQEWVVSSMMFGAAIGAIGSGPVSLNIGRKYTLLIGSLLFIAGSLGCAMAYNIEMLIIFRVLLGLAVGVASFTAPLYLSEIAPQRLRGSLISMYQLMITIGIVIAFISDTAFSFSGQWRWMLGVITVPAFILFLGVMMLPESPRWLALKKKDVEAHKILELLRGSSEEAKQELNAIRKSLKIKQGGWNLFKSNPNCRRAVYLGIALQVMQQFTGMNVVMYYAPKIFKIAGFASTEQQMWGTVIVGLVNVFATFIAIGLVDKWGRKPVLKVGFVVMASAMAILGYFLHAGISTSFEQYSAAFVLLVFIVGFAMSAGPLIWVLCSEIQPLKARDFGITVSTATNWIANMIVGATFLSFLQILGNANTFWLYAGLNLIFLIVTFFVIPETKGVSLEQIEDNLMAGKPLSKLGC